MAGARMHAEEASALGFADAVVETEKGVWIFEFKFNRSAASAIRQIRDRGYAEPYRAARSAKCEVRSAKRRKTNRPLSNSNSKLQLPITLVGIKFDPKIRNIAIPKFEPL